MTSSGGYGGATDTDVPTKTETKVEAESSDTKLEVEAPIQAHFAMWPYRTESVTWHSDWIRWQVSGEVKARFTATRDFKHTGGDSGEGHQHNTYHFSDDRGTVSEGPMCGPWSHGKVHSTLEGYVHPARPYMTTLLAPMHGNAWGMKRLSDGFNGFELFLGDGGALRFSVGLMYGSQEDSSLKGLQQISLIREDSRGFNGGFWDHEKEASIEFLEHGKFDSGKLLELDNKHLASVYTLSADLVMTKTEHLSVTPEEYGLFPNIDADNDFVMALPDDVTVVAPKAIPDVGPFRIAFGWKKDAAFTRYGELTYTIDRKIAGIRFVTFERQ